MSIFLFGLNAFSQSVSGIVTSDTGPLPGVNIVIKGTNVGTTTDFDGNYTITAKEADVLVFTYVGFLPQEVSISSKTIVNIIMQEDAQALNEIVVIGLGQTQNKRTVSTAIAKISADNITELSITRPEAALQGTIPGVTVAQNSGSPGSALTVRVRGVSTPNNSSPLYLVDGFQVPSLQYLNSADIESINVLKDAAAVAIYGARGGSGVVLVETKRGRRNSDHIKASVDFYTGFQNVTRDSDLMNKDEYLFFYKSAIQYANTFGEQFRPKTLGTISEVTAAQNALPNTDWLDVIFEDDVPITNVNVNVADGGETYSWSFSGGGFSQGGVVGGKDKSNFSRVNMRFTTDFDILPNLKVHTNVNYVSMSQDQVLENQNNETQGIGIVTAANSVGPIYPLYSETGTIFNPSFGTRGLNNNSQVMVNGVLLNSMNIYTFPLYMLDAADTNIGTSVRQFGTSVNYKPLDNLSATVSYSRYASDAISKTFQPDYNGTALDLEQNFFLATTNILNENIWSNTLDNFDANVEYTFENLGKHNLRLLGGTSFQRNQGTADFIQGSGLSVNTFDEAKLSLSNTISTTDPALSTNGFTTAINDSKLFSLYARALYNFDEKYLFTVSIRSDKSSKFGPNNQVGYFPAVSAGWVLSEEHFLSDSKNINLLKLRASWGINGVDNIREDEFNASYNDANDLERLGNPDIKWEEIKQTNIGLDLNMFSNKLGLTLDYYRKTTDGILIEFPPQLSSGAPGQTFDNVGGVTNEGVEALMSYREFAKKDRGFAWNINGSIGFNKNTFSDDGKALVLTGGSLRQFGTPVTNSLDGYALASFYGYEVDYIDNRGELIFKDLDGDGVVNTVDAQGNSTADTGDRAIIGNPYPDVTYGVQVGASFKGFDLNANLYGAFGNDIFDSRYNSAVPYANRPVEYIYNGLRPVLSGPSGSQGEVSDFFIKDGAFAKLKNVTLGYTFKVEGLEKLRVYAQGQNLWTITNYNGGDPEIGSSSNNPNATLDVGIDRGFYPQPTVIMFGIQFQY